MPGNIDPAGGWLLHFHSYLVIGDSGTVLVDTGVGPAGGEAANWLGVAGRLPSLLARTGVSSEEIDTVILTHIHLDHTGWNVEQDHPRFTNATYVVQQAELDHVRGGPTYERTIKPIAAAGQLRAVAGETELSGVRLLPQPSG